MGFDNVNVNVSGPVQPTSTYKTKVLKGNHSFASQVTEPNMKYVIKYDFDLGGAEITIPENCVLEFEGGSLSNGTINGNETRFSGNMNQVFNNITFTGSFNCSVIDTDWFKDLSEINALKVIQPLLNAENPKTVYIRDYGYNYRFAFNQEIKTALGLHSNTHIITNATFSVETNNNNDYRIFYTIGKNIIIDGGKYIGDLLTHGDSGDTSEYCHGIMAADAHNVEIRNAEVSYFPGDGVYSGKVEADGIDGLIIESLYIHHCGRQGISICDGKNVRVSNCNITNIGGYEHVSFNGPGCAIDCEPNAGQTLDNVIIENIICDVVGCGLAITGFDNINGVTTPRCKKVVVNNYKVSNLLHKTYPRDGGGYTIYGYALFVATQEDAIVNNFSVYQETPTDNWLIQNQFSTVTFDNLTVISPYDDSIELTENNTGIRNTANDKVVKIENSTIICPILFVQGGEICVENSYLDGYLCDRWGVTRGRRLVLDNCEFHGNITDIYTTTIIQNCSLFYKKYKDSDDLIFLNYHTRNRNISLIDNTFAMDENMNGAYLHIIDQYKNIGNNIVNIHNNIFNLEYNGLFAGEAWNFTNCERYITVNSSNNNIQGLNVSGKQMTYTTSLPFMRPNFPLIHDRQQQNPSANDYGLNQYNNITHKPGWWDGTRWADALGFSPCINAGDTASRPLVVYNIREGATIPNDKAKQLFAGFTFHYTGETDANFENGKYYVIVSILSNGSILWREENTFTGKVIPNNAPRRGSTANRPSAEYVYNNLYDGFDYYDTSLGFSVYPITKRYGEGTEENPYSYTIKWYVRETYTPTLTWRDAGFPYFDKTLNKPIFLRVTNDTTGDSNWVEADGANAGVLRSGTFSARPSCIRIYPGFAYLATNLYSPEGHGPGVMVYYKEVVNNVAVWIDALGRKVEDGYPLKYRGSFTAKPTLTADDAGWQYFDTTNNRIIIWNGTVWCDATGTPV